YPGTVQMRPPHTFQAGDRLTIDLRQRRVVLVEKVAAVLQPVRSRKRRQLAGGKSGAPFLRPNRCGCREENDDDPDQATCHDGGPGGLPTSNSGRAPRRGVNFWRRPFPTSATYRLPSGSTVAPCMFRKAPG